MVGKLNAGDLDGAVVEDAAALGQVMPVEIDGLLVEGEQEVEGVVEVWALAAPIPPASSAAAATIAIRVIRSVLRSGKEKGSIGPDNAEPDPANPARRYITSIIAYLQMRARCRPIRAFRH